MLYEQRYGQTKKTVRREGDVETRNSYRGKGRPGIGGSETRQLTKWFFFFSNKAKSKEMLVKELDLPGRKGKGREKSYICLIPRIF